MKHACASSVHDLQSRQRSARTLALARGVAFAALCAMVPLSSGAFAQSTPYYDRAIEASGISVVPTATPGLYAIDFKVRVANSSGTTLDMSVDASVSVNGVVVDSSYLSIGGPGTGGITSGGVGTGGSGPYVSGCLSQTCDGCPAQLGAIDPFCASMDTPNSFGLLCRCLYTFPWGTGPGLAFAIQPGDTIQVHLDAAAGAVIDADQLNDTADFQFSGIVQYCTAGTSSNGCVPAISGSGLPSLSASSFMISVANVEGARQGLLFYGISGRAAAPWGPGSTSLLCVKSPTQRMGVQFTGGNSGACNGTLVEDFIGFTSTHPSALGTPLFPGTVVDAQAWYRDPVAVKTTNLSDALEFTLLP
jgi:hypothetical protein